MKSQYLYQYPYFDLCYVEEDGYIIQTLQSVEDRGIQFLETPTILSAHNQMLAYLKGELIQFDVPYKLSGTPFQLKVYHALEQIPYGKTTSYLNIARIIGNEKASRAVGRAIHHNPIGIIVPCHRVIGSNQKLVGYAAGLDMKRNLLDIEKARYMK